DFIDRIYISTEQLSILLKINAFRFTGIDKHELLWKAYFKLQKNKPKTGQSLLFKSQHRDFELPEFEYSKLVEAYDQMEILGFPLCNQFELLEKLPDNTMTARDLKNYIGNDIEIYGNLVNSRKTGTSNGKYMYFGTFYDIEGGIFDIVIFPKAAEKYPLRSRGIYQCIGTVMEDLGYLSINIKSILRQNTQTDPRLVDSGFKVSLK
ncbi:MAG: hypothetical protein R3250_13300, partial [Melioribacteraceae bacterium]|nr:hypothetical protein [Melioribacteraceae bacterium]